MPRIVGMERLRSLSFLLKLPRWLLDPLGSLTSLIRLEDWKGALEYGLQDAASQREIFKQDIVGRENTAFFFNSKPISS